MKFSVDQLCEPRIGEETDHPIFQLHNNSVILPPYIITIL